ncbi:hypothetical protein OIDMADRAFT_34332 [Oidiodendron maius Zn]|uniref:Uncharacterized protein n=1 Tax=Oidiodendron maius (strain Zn) TaxID=913774 RepID=A0A0C3GFK9_OIDMZ|nr:hypothetical protein OIDMADRAFT_34332 [Oidiodendron maius Zn]
MKYGTPQAAMRATITQREGPELDRLGRGVVDGGFVALSTPGRVDLYADFPSMFCSSGLPSPSPGHPTRGWSLCGAGCGPGTPLDTATEATRQLVKMVREQCLVVDRTPSLFFLDWARRWNLQRWRAGRGRAEIGLSVLTVCWTVAGVAGKLLLLLRSCVICGVVSGVAAEVGDAPTVGLEAEMLPLLVMSGGGGGGGGGGSDASAPNGRIVHPPHKMDAKSTDTEQPPRDSQRCHQELRRHAATVMNGAGRHRSPGPDLLAGAERSGLTRDCSRPLHSGGATLLSPGGTIALRTSSSSSHGRKGRERERGSEGEGVRERKERVVEAPRQHRRGISPSVPTLIALPRLLSSPAGLLACWPRIVMASFSQRRSGGAGPPFKAAAGDCLRLVQYNTRYLRPPHTVLTGASCSTRYEHAEQSAFYIDSGPSVDLLPPWDPGDVRKGHHGFLRLALLVLLLYDTVRCRTRISVLEFCPPCEYSRSVPRVWQPAAGDLRFARFSPPLPSR